MDTTQLVEMFFTDEEMKSAFKSICGTVENGDIPIDKFSILDDLAEPLIRICNYINRLEDRISELVSIASSNRPIITVKEQSLPSEDLEEEVSRYIEDNFTLTDEVLEMPEEDRLYYMDKSDVLRLARHFAEWQKEQMPKWKKNGGLLRFAILEDENGRYVQHEGYKIYFNDLLKLPKED